MYLKHQLDIIYDTLTRQWQNTLDSSSIFLIFHCLYTSLIVYAKLAVLCPERPPIADQL